MVVNGRIADCTWIDLPTITDPRGDLTVMEGGTHIPFEIKRVFYLYNVPPGVDRGGHALKTCCQLLLAITGTLEVTLDDGAERKDVRLSDPRKGLFIPPLVWREMDHFLPGAVCLVLASQVYDPADYCRDYKAFVTNKNRKIRPV